MTKLSSAIIVLLATATQLASAEIVEEEWEAGMDGDLSLKYMLPLDAVGTGCSTKTNQCSRGDRKLWAVHNFMMWIGWVFFMAIVLSSARYFRHYWKRSIYIHTTFGILVFFITLTAAIMAWGRNWQKSDPAKAMEPNYYNDMGRRYFMHWRSWSALFENVASFYAFGLCITGAIAWFYRRYGNYGYHQYFGTTRVLQWGKFHKYISLAFCFFGQGLILFAIMDNYAYQPQWITVSVCQFLVLSAAIGYMEWRFNNIWWGEVPYEIPANVMTVEQFEKALHAGSKIMILDDLVLDVSEFYKAHPGGKFVIEHCIGTDIAKFFYGGYSLEDNMLPKPAFGFRHSNYARMIANDLAIARLDCREAGAELSRCRLRWDKDNVVNKLTRSFFFETIDREPRHNYKAYYPGIKYLTRHFWMRSMDQPTVIRHYTTCNAMATHFYQELVRVLKDPSQVETFDKGLLNTNDSNTMTFTIKNYKKEGGFSYKPFETDQRGEYEIKGPMGKGLAPEREGIHIAFCAGTGALCFVDIMAHVALAELGLLTAEDHQAGSIQPDRFRMKLYASFPSKAEGVAWDLMESLDNYCKQKGSNSFELIPRLSKEKVNTARWNEAWVENTLLKYPAKEVQRMWVCGPPVMNETFDKALMDMRTRLNPNQLINQFRIELL